ncbi:UTP--glucose-1-phosphate uridylyltransferase [Tetranychus urticae]|uniref:UTP--glucose-1-phosphate uridylyltransferase n=1 Tax=Tetranychus urticae TaxID=32264 RepID=T1JV86_TETUR|nr:UTP--glucose-1-phosphate uridylyltransferase [Tetranychus urticae]
MPSSDHSSTPNTTSPSMEQRKGDFSVYAVQTRPKLVAEKPGLSEDELQKMLEARWNNLSDDQKAEYFARETNGTDKTSAVKSPVKQEAAAPRGRRRSSELRLNFENGDASKFRELTKKDAATQLAAELDKLLAPVPCDQRPQLEEDFCGFNKLFKKFIDGTGPSLVWDKIEPLQSDAIINYDSLSSPTVDEIRTLLTKLVVVKLNGGLGTSMGCVGPKSLIPVRNELTFLDLTVQNIEQLNKAYGVDVPLVLMNSFNTDADTQKVSRKYRGCKVSIYTFLQSRYPRLNKETLLPIATSIDSDPEDWYPPGHGDFYESFAKSGLLADFLAEGREYVFISNIDNLGATVDLNILKFLLDAKRVNRPSFLMEVTDKTQADVKGGTLIQYEGKLRLLEIAQVPKEHVDEFKSVKKFKIFNTNNLWVSLESIDGLLKSDGINMEIIVNPKSLENGLNVIQLETAAGAAMKDFENPVGINVPRSRFLPVKKTQDLLLVMSNLYSLNQGCLKVNPARPFPTVPLVKLGDAHFAKVRDFLSRFASIPDMLELNHLTVSGDVTFGRGVKLQGTVIIIANHGDRIDIPAGSVLENKIVSGNLRILDH